MSSSIGYISRSVDTIDANSRIPSSFIISRTRRVIRGKKKIVRFAADYVELDTHTYLHLYQLQNIVCCHLDIFRGRTNKENNVGFRECTNSARQSNELSHTAFLQRYRTKGSQNFQNSRTFSHKNQLLVNLCINYNTLLALDLSLRIVLSQLESTVP